MQSDKVIFVIRENQGQGLNCEFVFVCLYLCICNLRFATRQNNLVIWESQRCIGDNLYCHSKVLICIVILKVPKFVSSLGTFRTDEGSSWRLSRDSPERSHRDYHQVTIKIMVTIKILIIMVFSMKLTKLEIIMITIMIAVKVNADHEE